MTAVSVPGRALSEMLSSSVLLPSMVHVMPCTSRPPVRVSASVSVRRTRVPPLNTRSMLPMVTTSPSLQRGDLDPDAVDERAVDASVVADLGAGGGGHQRGVVARGQHVGDDDVVVGGAADLDRAAAVPRRHAPAQDPEHARRQVAAVPGARSRRRAHLGGGRVELGEVLGGGRRADRLRGAGRVAGLRRRRVSTGGVARRRCGRRGEGREAPVDGGPGVRVGPERCAPGGVVAGATGTEVVCGGRPASPWWRPTSKVSRGPSGLPMLRLCPSVRSTVGTRRPLTNMPLRLPLSIATHRPWSKRRTRWAREISGWAMRTSARRSRPTTTSLPGANVRATRRSERSARAGRVGSSEPDDRRHWTRRPTLSVA